MTCMLSSLAKFSNQDEKRTWKHTWGRTRRGRLAHVILTHAENQTCLSGLSWPRSTGVHGDPLSNAKSQAQLQVLEGLLGHPPFSKHPGGFRHMLEFERHCSKNLGALTCDSRDKNQRSLY